jgi:4,5-DOPA dioxygenase extradiol
VSGLPTLFVPHGAPTFVLAPGAAGAALAGVARKLPRPRAIIVVSAHWDTAVPTFGASLKPETIHDYSGFPRELYALRYPATGAYCAAMDARNLLEDAGIAARLDLERGLDHGAWMPLSLMYPDADVPVVPMSIQSTLGPAHHFSVGRVLAPLVGQGVLIVASGNLTHNLRHFGQYWQQPVGPAYVGEFSDWMWRRLEAGDTDAVLAYRDSAPGAREAHPSDDHLLPLYVALGAAGEALHADRFFTGIYDNVLSMDAYAFWPQAA